MIASRLPEADIDVPLGPGFVASVAAVTGMCRGDTGDLAQLLLTHPGPRRANETAEAVEHGMRRLAAALRLGPGGEPPPVIGARIAVHRGRAVLDYGHDRYVMALPPPPRDWLVLLGTGAPCRVCLVAAPLAPGADRAASDAHLRESLASGLVMWGTAHARRRC
ncbi:hypothetical protein OG338_13850 [Streptomyces sp. NBC_00726]|uniref:hypothetical protein n=1 Tax=Streptomyces sp. NBC_00726 TaxID=2903674 RepID=UPI00386EFC00